MARRKKGFPLFFIVILLVTLAIIIGCLYHSEIIKGLRRFSDWVTNEPRQEETLDEPPEGGEELPPTSDDAGDNTDEETPPAVAKYAITYKGVLYGEVIEIPEYMYLSGSEYPTEYEKGQGASVPELREYYPVTDLKDIAFYGWYLDEECTQAFDGVISTESTGDITLYAKFVYWHWTPNY